MQIDTYGTSLQHGRVHLSTGNVYRHGLCDDIEHLAVGVFVHVCGLAIEVATVGRQKTATVELLLLVDTATSDASQLAILQAWTVGSYGYIPYHYSSCASLLTTPYAYTYVLLVAVLHSTYYGWQ